MYQGAKPSQSPSVTAPPKGEPRGCVLVQEMEHIIPIRSIKLFYDHLLKLVLLLRKAYSVTVKVMTVMARPLK